MLAVFVVVASTDIDCCDIKVWGHNGDVAKTSPGFSEAKITDELDNLAVIASLE